MGTIPGEPDNSSQYMWGDWLALFRFLTSPRMGLAPEPAAQAPPAAAQAPPAAAQAPPAAAQPGAQSGAQSGNLGSFFPSDPAARSSLSFSKGPVANPALPNQRASAQGGNSNFNFINPSDKPGLGGRSRSRKRSVSKRTRRKGVAKKQNSKKNKRQSRRKVRRASSRKSRK
jgi:hypothetical protein